MIPTRFLVSRRTQDTTRVMHVFIYRACTFYSWPFNAIRLTFMNPTAWSYNPIPKDGLGWSRFARRYSGNLILISFPLATKMFQFARLLLL